MTSSTPGELLYREDRCWLIGHHKPRDCSYFSREFLIYTKPAKKHSRCSSFNFFPADDGKKRWDWGIVVPWARVSLLLVARKCFWIRRRTEVLCSLCRLSTPSWWTARGSTKVTSSGPSFRGDAMAHTTSNMCRQQGGSLPQQYSRARRAQGPGIDTVEIPRLITPYIYRRDISHTYAFQDELGYTAGTAV